jgi:hypothetical protein
MKIADMRVGMRVEHPHHGMGVVKALSEHLAEVDFNGMVKSIDPVTGKLEPFEPKAELKGLEVPLKEFIARTVEAVAQEMNLQAPSGGEEIVKELALRWKKGALVLKSADASLQPKEVPLEAFFHKIVMMRNNLRVLEQKINAHTGLSDADKVEIQQYISRCYGSMTTFNVLFKNREDQFSSKDEN